MCIERRKGEKKRKRCAGDCLGMRSFKFRTRHIGRSHILSEESNFFSLLKNDISPMLSRNFLIVFRGI
jgi:hypothetical protein